MAPMLLADLGDVSLEYFVVPGNAAHAPLVLLHEGLGSARLWRDFPVELARRLDTRALVYSRAGYGRSSGLKAPREPRYLHEEALDVLPRVLDRAKLDRPLLVGHSDGASIALIYAAHHPGRVAGLVLMAPHVFVEDVSLAGIRHVREQYEGGGLRERLAKHHDHVEDAFRGWSEIWLSERFASWSLADEVQRLATPTLLIQGEADAFGTLAQLDAFEAATRASITRLVLADCGHSPHRDQKDRVIDAIAAFAARLGTA